MIDHLDAQIVRFVERSPFVLLATTDAAGQPSVSPKGDAPGFVQVTTDESGRGAALLIPDRPGNQLIFGLQNLVCGSPRVGLLFCVPGTATTLRCGGRATLTCDPALLAPLAARGIEPKLAVHVQVSSS